MTEVEAPQKSQEVHNMRLLADNLPPPGALLTLDAQMTQAYQNDPLPLEIFEALRTGAQRNRTLSLVDCRSVNKNFSTKTDFIYLMMRSIVCKSYRGHITHQLPDTQDVNEHSNY